MALTSIPISPETREELRSLGKKGETYDEIIQKLLGSKMESDSYNKVKVR